MIRISNALTARRDSLKNDDRGFTLIELLVVVLIIGVLAAIAIPIFLGQQEQAKGSSVESALTNAKTAIIASMVDTGTFPTATEMTAILAEAAGGPSSDVNITSAGGAAAFCLTGTHDDLAATKTWAADDKGGVLEDAACSATFVATATTP